MRRLWWAWCLGTVLMLGCKSWFGPEPAEAPPVLCSPLELPAIEQLAALPAGSPLRSWVIFTDRNTCRANQDTREKMGWPIPPDMRRGTPP